METAGPCPYCKCPMVRLHRSRRRNVHASRQGLPYNHVTRDHILPKAWGGLNTVDNRRPCCSRCNGYRAAAGHCVGALACMIAVAESSGVTLRTVGRRWKLPRINSLPIADAT